MMEKAIYDDIDWVIRAVEEHHGDERQEDVRTCTSAPTSGT
jgi:hypothetical protein